MHLELHYPPDYDSYTKEQKYQWLLKAFIELNKLTEKVHKELNKVR